jgi:hypothetical protein
LALRVSSSDDPQMTSHELLLSHIVEMRKEPRRQKFLDKDYLLQIGIAQCDPLPIDLLDQESAVSLHSVFRFFLLGLS